MLVGMISDDAPAAATLEDGYVLGVVVAGTPLGNAGDASPRLQRALAVADVIAAEDTRRTRALCDALGVVPRGKGVSNFDHNEASRVEGLLEVARSGMVLVVSDAGMPVVSDPGFPLVEAAHDAGIRVSSVPGPSAVTTALALCGLRVGHFAFDGFAPRKPGARRAWLESLRGERRAVCFFESPHRIASTLDDAASVLGEQRRVAVCRELTKAFEEVKRGSLGEVAAWAKGGVRGEITVVLEGAAASAQPVGEDELAACVEEVERLVASGERLKSACAWVAERVGGVSKKQLYEAVLLARSEG